MGNHARVLRRILTALVVFAVFYWWGVSTGKGRHTRRRRPRSFEQHPPPAPPHAAAEPPVLKDHPTQHQGAAAKQRVHRASPVRDSSDPHVFVPSNEWQVIQPGQAVPAGLHIKVDLQTGHKMARLLQNRPGITLPSERRDTAAIKPRPKTGAERRRARLAQKHHQHAKWF
eukprot:m.211894 g.211894  ORF g.211894 m.211894 type:complete len:171 (-) comp25730_c0_seq1:15-527(-)